MTLEPQPMLELKQSDSPADSVNDEQRYSKWWETKHKGTALSLFELFYDESELDEVFEQRYVVDHRPWTPEYEVDERYCPEKRKMA